MKSDIGRDERPLEKFDPLKLVDIFRMKELRTNGCCWIRNGWLC